MILNESHPTPRRKRDPWNKDHMIGQKPAMKPKDVWTIRVRLQVAGRSVIWLCSIWPLTAGSGAAASSASK